MNNLEKTKSEITTLVEETKQLVSYGREIALKVAYNIWTIREALYPDKNKHQDFVRFCEEEFGIKSSAISKYERIGDGFYAHGYTPESFKVDDEYKDYEVVYYASRLPVPVEERHATAMVLTRAETKKTKAELDGHNPDFQLVCVHHGCWLPKDAHP